MTMGSGCEIIIFVIDNTSLTLIFQNFGFQTLNEFTTLSTDRAEIIITIIIIIKRGWHCKAGRERLAPSQSEDPNPTTPTHRKKEEKGKTVGDKE